MSQHFFSFSCQRRTCLRQFCSCCSILKNFFFYNQTYYKYMLFQTDIIIILWVIYMGVFTSVQFSHSVMSNFWNPMDCSMPGFPVHHQLPELAETHVHRVGDAIQPSHLLSSPSLLSSIFPSIRVFSKSVLHIRWPKYWSFRFLVYKCVCICM